MKLFYVSNRTGEEEAGTRKNLERLGFPMGGNVDTMLFARKKPDWGSAKGTRRAFVAKDYRVLLMLGDNFGDFTDAYRGSEAERLKVYEDNKDALGPRVDHAGEPGLRLVRDPRRSGTTSRSRRTSSARRSATCSIRGRGRPIENRELRVTAAPDADLIPPL